MKTRINSPATLRKASKYLTTADPAMAALIARIGPCRLQVQQDSDLFLSLARSIIFQQLHGKAAETIYQRTCALFPRSKQFTAKDIKRATEEKLRSAGLSRNKQLALRDLARDGKEREVSRKELSAAILDSQARNPNQPVLISGDKNVKYEAVLEIMDELQRQQVKRVALNVQVSGK